VFWYFTLQNLVLQDDFSLGIIVDNQRLLLEGRVWGFEEEGEVVGIE
jgi:hypothetical protein